MTSPISVSVHVPVSNQQAWRLFTTPSAIMQWNQASPEWHCPKATVDLRVGGAHVARMEARDGSFGFDFSGVYEEVDAPRALTLRLGDGRASRTTFEPEGAGTRVTTIFDPEATNAADMQRSGWQALLNSYAAFATQSASTVAEATVAEATVAEATVAEAR